MNKIALAIIIFFLAVMSSESMACLTIPAPSKTITSLYGWRFHPVFKRWRLHRGLDLRAAIGTTLTASENGVVQVASSASGGNELRIIGNDGTVTRYLHLTRSLVDAGTKVSAGQQIAISGNTGHASDAPHLHFEVYPNGGKGDVNPEPFLCAGATRKAGADSVDGFPIKACNPDGGQCGGDGTLPVAAAGTGEQSVPGPKIEQFDDMSTNEIISSEVMKRFGNPDWYRELAERTTIPLLIEYIHMLALQQYIDFYKSLSRDRVETLLATKLARDNKREIEARLQRQRDVTAKAGN